ncbi:hypothetical protein PW52_08695 [Tamlana sedimentorum]|uniref:Uncharacterized protein n=2 Tax=Neotamlana sedimentorum TaxID=1435349 RepID=A0A0D7WDJ7_9FLAO|nr:hypothetical protein PW52_08695 [Tamlana sedimentorum]
MTINLNINGSGVNETHGVAGNHALNEVAPPPTDITTEFAQDVGTSVDVPAPQATDFESDVAAVDGFVPSPEGFNESENSIDIVGVPNPDLALGDALQESASELPEPMALEMLEASETPKKTTRSRATKKK